MFHGGMLLLLQRLRRQRCCIEQWFNHHSDELRRFILRKFPGSADADDILHDVFVIALVKIDQYVETGNARAYLFQVARNLLKAHRRKCKKRSAEKNELLEALADHRTVVDLPEQHDSLRALQSYLHRLASAERTVIRLRITQGVPFKMIASDLGCPTNTAISHFRRGIQKLRKWLECE